MRGKYIIFERNGLEYPVLIPDHFVTHKEVKMNEFIDKPIRAGFFSIGSNATGGIHCSVWGESVSLKLNSNPNDASLIMKQFNPE